MLNSHVYMYNNKLHWCRVGTRYVYMYSSIDYCTNKKAEVNDWLSVIGLATHTIVIKIYKLSVATYVNGIEANIASWSE